jgi:fumarylpyruvate hydrolase
MSGKWVGIRIDRSQVRFLVSTWTTDIAYVCMCVSYLHYSLSHVRSVFFTKPADAVVPTKSSIPYPLGTSNLHYEVELVIAIGKDGVTIPVEEARNYIFGYAVGIDLTRRDLQSLAKEKGLPWDTAKALDQGAPISAITKGSSLDTSNKISLTVNGEEKQTGTLNQMIWTVEDIVSHLSNSFRLQPGDLIFTGTPKGVGPIVPGDHVKGMIGSLEDIEFTLSE